MEQNEKTKDQTNETDEIELRSNDVQEILKRPPHSLIRYGIAVVCSVMLLLILGSFLFKYPDIVSGEVIITTENPPVWLIGRSSGRLKELFCTDKEKVTSNRLLGVIENTASTDDIYLLDSLLSLVSFSDTSLYIPLHLYTKKMELGEVQKSFSVFIRIVAQYNNFLKANLTVQERNTLLKQLKSRKSYIYNLEAQLNMKKRELEIIQSIWERGKKMYDIGGISQAELEQMEQNCLSLKQSLSQLEASMISESIENIQLKESLNKLSLQFLQEKNSAFAELSTTYRELKVAIDNWKQNYLLITPINGIVTFNHIWQKNQFVETGNKVMAIIPEKPGEIIGMITLSSAGIGKVRKGQSVNIKLDGYPYIEYGLLKAKVRNISLISDDNKYTIEIEFENKLKTTTGKILNFPGELTGQAEIITESRSLGVRLVSPLGYLLRK